MASETVPLGIDDEKVTAWFEQHIKEAEPPLTFDRVAGGHSCLTYIVKDSAGQRFVLRRPPLGHVLATAHDVVREHKIMSALQDTGVPVPRMLGVCADNDVNEAPFYIMSYVDGVVLHSAELATKLLPDDEARKHAADSLVDALVALHAVDIDAVGLGDLARRTGYLDRQLKRWSAQWEASKTRELPGMEQLHEWLVANRPEEEPAGVAHGDYRLGNLLHAPDGTVLAILDWELCTLGPPLADVSYLLRSWTAEGTSGAPGFPPREYVAERYASASGRSIADLDYWMAFNAWRSAAIAEGVYRRYLDGNMGAQMENIEIYARSVEVTVAAGLNSAGLA